MENSLWPNSIEFLERKKIKRQQFGHITIVDRTTLRQWKKQQKKSPRNGCHSRDEYSAASALKWRSL